LRKASNSNAPAAEAGPIALASRPVRGHTAETRIQAPWRTRSMIGGGDAAFAAAPRAAI
jgi:hypothetical protein